MDRSGPGLELAGPCVSPTEPWPCPSGLLPILPAEAQGGLSVQKKGFLQRGGGTGSSISFLADSQHTHPPQSFPCHLPAAALCTSHRGSLAQRGLPGKCFGFHFRLQVIFKPAQFPAPCESQWGSVREAKDPVLSSRKNSILVRKTRPHQRNVPNKHPKINSAPPKLFLLVQGLCEKV